MQGVQPLNLHESTASQALLTVVVYLRRPGHGRGGEHFPEAQKIGKGWKITFYKIKALFWEGKDQRKARPVNKLR